MNPLRNARRALVGSLAALTVAAASAQITLYERPEFRGRAAEATGWVNDLSRYGFNSQAASVMVRSGRWEVCEDIRYEGHCVVLRRGNYDSLRAMGLSAPIASVRPALAGVERDMPTPPKVPAYEFRRRPNERLTEVPVTHARAIVGAPEERCWMEREEVAAQRGEPNVGGAIAGAVIGGILGHQVGGGVGKDLATAGGAVAGGVIGSNVGRKKQAATQQEVRRCESVPSTTPTYWDVTYTHRGRQHRVQMQHDPGPTILVNRRGEPRE